MDGTQNFLSALRGFGGFNKDDPYQFLRPEPVTQGGGDTPSPAGGGAPTGNLGAGLLAGSAFGGGGLGSLGGGLGGAQANPYTPPAANNNAPVASAPGTTSFLNSLGRAGAAPAGLAGTAGVPAADGSAIGALGAGGGGGGGGYSGQVDYGHGLNSSNTVGNPNDINPNTGMNYWDWMQMYQDRGYPMNSVGPNDKGGYTSPDGWDPVNKRWGNAFTSFDSQPSVGDHWTQQAMQNNPNAAGYVAPAVTQNTPAGSLAPASAASNPSSANPAMGAVGGPGSYGYDENKYYGR